MEDQIIYYSPVICYEVIPHQNSYSVDVYFQGSKDSDDENLHSFLKDFSEDKETTLNFVISLSKNAALPLHVPELAEEFLSA